MEFRKHFRYVRLLHLQLSVCEPRSKNLLVLLPSLHALSQLSIMCLKCCHRLCLLHLFDCLSSFGPCAIRKLAAPVVREHSVLALPGISSATSASYYLVISASYYLFRFNVHDSFQITSSVLWSVFETQTWTSHSGDAFLFSCRRDTSRLESFTHISAQKTPIFKNVSRPTCGHRNLNRETLQ